MHYSTAPSNIILFIMLCFLICYIAAWVLAMTIITKAAREKGYTELDGKLWFIGLFSTPVCPAVIVAALPDKRLLQNISSESKTASIDSELPKL